MSEIQRRGILLVLSSPSGAGKTTITRALAAADPLVSISISVTTRPPREGEVDEQEKKDEPEVIPDVEPRGSQKAREGKVKDRQREQRRGGIAADAPSQPPGEKSGRCQGKHGEQDMCIGVALLIAGKEEAQKLDEVGAEDAALKGAPMRPSDDDAVSRTDRLTVILLKEHHDQTELHGGEEYCQQRPGEVLFRFRCHAPWPSCPPKEILLHSRRFGHRPDRLLAAARTARPPSSARGSNATDSALDFGL